MNFRKAPATIILILSLCGAGSTGAEADLFDECYPNKSVEACNRLVAAQTNDLDRAGALKMRADTYRLMSKCDQAISDYSEALKFTPASAPALAGRADCYRVKNQIDDAKRDIDEAIRLAPDFVLGFRVRAFIFFAQKDFGNALINYNLALSVSPDDKDALLYRASVHIARSEHAEAISDLIRAKEAGDKSTWRPKSLAFLYIRQGDFGEAVDAYSEALTFNPNDREALWGRVNLNLRRELYATANEDLDTLTKLFPSDPAVLVARGRVKTATGFPYNSLSDYNAALAIDPNNASAFGGRSLAQYAMKEYSKALDDAQSAVRLDGKNADYYYARGLALYALGYRDDAFNDMRTARRFDASSGENKAGMWLGAHSR
jgi:tetratricopeptide (TPR) repeat protein